MRADDFFNFPESLKRFSYFFPADDAPWTWLPNIEKALLAYQNFTPKEQENVFLKKTKKLFSQSTAVAIGKNVHIGKNVKLPITCTIEDNVYIGDNTEIRSGALIRKNVIIGENCLIGNSCEIKNSLIMDYVQMAHFNYIGDSILGSHVHLAAGAILSNLRFDRQLIAIKIGQEKIPTELKKLGAILGEYAQIGCNSILLPGALIGKNSIVSAGTTFGGFLDPNRMLYLETKTVIKDVVTNG
ncbi:MAG: UDP-N-acetylglucosamine diphosphorylase [Puniceicoccales bacterium]|jgi:NDP-sugar pyrophosphorylase family protein|nr:UDP-N-acetylglucosamine diphosphorylase [Puniceicoccales bacterium]